MIMKPLFIQYPKCGTCRKAAQWLKNNHIDVTIRDIVSDNPTQQELSVWIEKSGKLYKNSSIQTDYAIKN